MLASAAYFLLHPNPGPAAEKQAKISVTLEKIAEVEGITASDEDIEAEFKSLAEQNGMPSWVTVDSKKMEGVFKQAPDRADIAGDINESLIVELYSR